jgi:hypothetical protein
MMRGSLEKAQQDSSQPEQHLAGVGLLFLPKCMLPLAMPLVGGFMPLLSVKQPNTLLKWSQRLLSRPMLLRKLRFVPHGCSVMFFAVMAGISATASAAMQETVQESVQQSAHQHGVATANLVWQSPQLMIELMLPAQDVLGFEHQAKTAEQQQRIDATKAWLHDTNKVFVIADATCTPSSIELSGFDALDLKAASHKHHDTHHHEHKHDDSHDHSHDHSAGHVDLTASYLLDCDTPPSSIGFAVLANYPAVTKVNLTAIVNGQQQAITLTQARSQLNLVD